MWVEGNRTKTNKNDKNKQNNGYRAKERTVYTYFGDIAGSVQTTAIKQGVPFFLVEGLAFNL